MKTVTHLAGAQLRCGMCGHQLEASTGEAEQLRDDKWLPTNYALVWPCPTCVGAIPEVNRPNHMIVALGKGGYAPLGASAAEARDVPSLNEEET